MHHSNKCFLRNKEWICVKNNDELCIKILNTKVLATKYGMAYDPSPLPEIGSEDLYYEVRYNYIYIYIEIGVIIVLLLLLLPDWVSSSGSLSSKL